MCNPVSTSEGDHANINENQATLLRNQYSNLAVKTAAEDVCNRPRRTYQEALPNDDMTGHFTLFRFRFNKTGTYYKAFSKTPGWRDSRQIARIHTARSRYSAWLDMT